MTRDEILAEINALEAEKTQLKATIAGVKIVVTELTVN